MWTADGDAGRHLRLAGVRCLKGCGFEGRWEGIGIVADGGEVLDQRKRRAVDRSGGCFEVVVWLSLFSC